MGRRASGWFAPLAVAVAVVVLDQVTKAWALDALGDGRTIDVVWTLQWNLAFNRGMAFSQAQGFGPVIAIVATLVVVWLLASLRSVGGRLATFGMGCVLGGAIGNLIDRAFRDDAWLRGAVVDFIDFQWFPIFNIADVAINVGAGALILNYFLAARHLPDDSERDADGDAVGHDPDPDLASEPVDVDPAESATDVP